MPENTKKIYIHALGCKTNQYEAEAVAAGFAELGYGLTEDASTADVCIINTCTVTGEAGRKSRQFLRRARKENPEAVLVAMGCHSQLEDIGDICDIVTGTFDRAQIIDAVGEYLRVRDGFPAENTDTAEAVEVSAVHPTATPSNDREYEELGLNLNQTETRAQIKIQDGCNQFCAYCAICLARGRVRSREREPILAEAKALAVKGHREIVLTGIHICSFEADKGRDATALVELIEQLAAIDGIERVRLGSLEPGSLTPEVTRRLMKIDKLCPHFHISLQSGSDTVLARMRRQYTAAEYADAVRRIRAFVPDAAFTTDVMVAFPGETEEEHRESMRFIESIAFARIHVFRFSPRQGTPAARMRQVPGEISARRAAEADAVGRRMTREYLKQFIDKPLRVLLETPSDLFGETAAEAGESADGNTADALAANVFPKVKTAFPELSPGDFIAVEGYSDRYIRVVCLLPAGTDRKAGDSVTVAADGIVGDRVVGHVLPRGDGTPD